MVERLFLAVPRGCLQFVIVVFPDHTHLLFKTSICENSIVRGGGLKMINIRAFINALKLTWLRRLITYDS